jgi:hypothetical protein
MCEVGAFPDSRYPPAKPSCHESLDVRLHQFEHGANELEEINPWNSTAFAAQPAKRGV